MSTLSKKIEKLLRQSVWTDDERKWLLNILECNECNELKEIMHKSFLEDLQKGEMLDPKVSEKLLNSLHQKISSSPKQRKAIVLRVQILRLAAACFVGILVLSVIFWINSNSKQLTIQPTANVTKLKDDALPGGNKAILTLADGSSILLDEANNGLLTHQGNTDVTKHDGKLDYTTSGIYDGKVMYNTIATPNGGQYQVELPDGSKVWLNAASSIHFPTAFSGNERRVEMTGEAYFEVAKNKAKPFIVGVNGASIKVLGTHFNVMAYSDEATLNTTLLEGSVKFEKDNQHELLQPGQQLQLTQLGNLKVVNGINLSEVVSWKNGFFEFDGVSFETIARQLSRWYNVDVLYKRKIDELFYAKIPMNTKLSVVLKALELTGKVHFKIEGTKILILP